MKALILAAGLGTRLRPLTLDYAKPALPVVGIPTFWYGAWQLNNELRPKAFALNMGHAPDSVKQAAEDLELAHHTGIKFHYSDESQQILGSSGALWKLASWIGNETLAVCNGDSICFPSWKAMLSFHVAKKSLLTLHVRAFKKAREEYTDIKLSLDGKVLALGEKAKQGVMFSGAYLFEPQLLKRLPTGASELRPTLLEPLIREGKLYAFQEDTDWFDTGTIASYVDTQFHLISRLPQARTLVEVKMREEPAGAWVPRFWKHGVPALNAPVILTGNQQEWTEHNSFFGPRFIGIEAPPPGIQVPFRDTLIFRNFIEKI